MHKIENEGLTPIRVRNGKVIVDEREFYHFQLPDGRWATTKADTCEEAAARIRETLSVEVLKEAV